MTRPLEISASGTEAELGAGNISELEAEIMREAISGMPVCVGSCAELLPQFTDAEIHSAILRLSRDLGFLKPASDREPDYFMCYLYDRRGLRRLLAESECTSRR